MMIKLRTTASLALAMLFIFSGAKSFASCAALLEGKEQVERVKKAITRTKGIAIVEEGFDDAAGRSLARFDRANRKIRLLPDASLMQDQINLHHEVVHGTSDYNFRMHPSPKTAALVVTFDSNEPISDKLPESYQFHFILDEIKATYKTSLYLASIVRYYGRSGHYTSETMPDNADRAYRNSLAMRIVAVELLTALEKTIWDDAEKGQFPTGMTISQYAEDTKGLYNIGIPISRQDGSVVRATLPIQFNTGDAKPGDELAIDFPDFINQLLHVCYEGIDFANIQKAPPRTTSRGDGTR